MKKNVYGKLVDLARDLRRFRRECKRDTKADDLNLFEQVEAKGAWSAYVYVVRRIESILKDTTE